MNTIFSHQISRRALAPVIPSNEIWLPLVQTQQPGLAPKRLIRTASGIDQTTFDLSVKVKKGSIVLALTRTIISGGLKVAVVPDEYDGALLNQRVAAIVPSSDAMHPALLFAYLSTNIVVDYVKDRVNTLMQPNLSIVDLRAMPVPVPPITEQTLIVRQVESLRFETQRLATIYERKLAALDDLKKSLLHQAFSGEL